MISFLDDNEFVEVEDGYIGKPMKTETPGFNLHTAEGRELCQHVRNRHESINSCLKEWKCLEEKCRHGLTKHSAMFYAVAVVLQIMLNSGEITLFDAHYDNDNFPNLM